MRHLFYSSIEQLDDLDINTKGRNKIKGSFIVRNEQGLHTRPSTELVKCANSFKSDMRLIYQKIMIDAKSVLDILTLSAERGAKIYVEAEGEDAEDAVKALIDLASNKFNIHY